MLNGQSSQLRLGHGTALPQPVLTDGCSGLGAASAASSAPFAGAWAGAGIAWGSCCGCARAGSEARVGEAAAAGWGVSDFMAATATKASSPASAMVNGRNRLFKRVTSSPFLWYPVFQTENGRPDSHRLVQIADSAAQRTRMSARWSLSPAAATSTVGKPGEAEMTSGPSGVAMIVSSDLVPVMEGFQAKA